MGRGKVFPSSSARSLVSPLRRLVQSPDRLARALELPGDAWIAEVGAGPGFFTGALARVVPDGGVLLFDLQLEMAAFARERLPSSRITFAVADAMRLPLADASVDAVLLATMLGEVPDRDACLREALRVLRRPSGTLAVAETRRDSDFLPLAQLRAEAEAAGFAFVGHRGFRWQYVAGFRPV
jgi:ubiquinone/menaquinone biosynthesis C-methylase UbiE